MEVIEALPIKQRHSNRILKGVGENCLDLHVTRVAYTDGSRALVSVWKIQKFRHRIGFLFSGTINVAIMSEMHPPISISIGNYETLLP